MEESEIIDQYLRGELDAPQSERFLSRLHTDQALQKHVALRKLVLAGISEAYAEDLKSKLMAFDSSLENKKRFQFSWKMAAVFVFLIVGGSVLYLSTQKADPLNFVLNEPGLPNTMGISKGVEFNNAMSAFKQGDFITSGREFDKLLASNQQNDTLLYFSGFCDFSNAQESIALQKWNGITVQSAFYTKAQYQSAVAYWMQGDEEKAKELLLNVVTIDKGPFQESAKKALHALE